MKKSIILSLLLFTLAAVSYAKPKPLWNLKVLSVKKNVLYFKVNKSFVGGTVEVYDSDQKFIEAEELPHTHTMIYFEEMPAGSYTIKVRKGDRATEVRYNNI